MKKYLLLLIMSVTLSFAQEMQDQLLVVASNIGNVGVNSSGDLIFKLKGSKYVHDNSVPAFDATSTSNTYLVVRRGDILYPTLLKEILVILKNYNSVTTRQFLITLDAKSNNRIININWWHN